MISIALLSHLYRLFRRFLTYLAALRPASRFFWSCTLLTAALLPAQGRQELTTNSPAVIADLLYRDGKWKNALIAYERALSLNAQDSRSALNAADCFEQLGDFSKAIEAYQRAIKIESARTAGYLALSMLYAKTGASQLAVDSLNEAINNGFDDGRSVLREKAFASLHNDLGFLRALRRLLGNGFTGFERVTPSKDEMRAGIQLLASTIQSRSPNAYRTYSREDWDARTKAAIDQVESLDTTGYFVELVSLAGLAGDVHTAVFPEPSSDVLHYVYPLRFWRFSDGVFIRAAAPALSSLVGAKVLAIGGVPIDIAWHRLMDKVPTENEWMSMYMVQFYMEFPGFLHALDLGETETQGKWTLELPDGSRRDIQIEATEQIGWQGAINTSLGIIAPEGYVEGHDALAEPPLWLKHRDRNYWYEYLALQNTVFLQINIPRNDHNHPWEQFVDEVCDVVRARHAERLVIDLRHNGGGYQYMAQKLVHGIISTPSIDRPGHLFVLTSRITQSAGVYFAVKLEQETYSIFVGEPGGAHPNFFNSPMGQHVTQALPGSDILFRASNVLIQGSDQQDQRKFIAPDISVSMSYEDYSKGRDPILAAALDASVNDAEKYFSDEGGRPIPLYFRWRRPSQRIAFTDDQWIRLKR